MDHAQFQHPSANLGRVELVEPGQPSGPLIVLIGAWNAMFVYEPLIAHLPPDVSAVVVSLLPDTDDHLSTVIVDIPGNAQFVVEQLAAATFACTNRPLVVLGHSRGGLVAHEVASELHSSGCDIRLEVLVDTVFPGEEERRPQLIAAARREKYRLLLDSGQYRSVARELSRKALARCRRLALQVGTALVRYTSVDGVARVRSGTVRPLTEADYTPRAAVHPVLVYRASRSEASRTTERWRAIVPHLDEVVVEGRHGGEDGVLGRDRVDQIAVDLTERIAAFTAS